MMGEEIDEERERVFSMTGEDLRDDEFLQESVAVFEGYDTVPKLGRERKAVPGSGDEVSGLLEYECSWLVPALQQRQPVTYVDRRKIEEVAERLIQPGVLDTYPDMREEELEDWNDDESFKTSNSDWNNSDLTVACEHYGKAVPGATFTDSLFRGDDVFRAAGSVELVDSYVSGDHAMKSVPEVRLDGCVVEGSDVLRCTEDVTLVDSIVYGEQVLASVGDVTLDHSFLLSDRLFQSTDPGGSAEVYNSVVVAEKFDSELSDVSIRDSVVLVGEGLSDRVDVRESYVIEHGGLQYYDETGGRYDGEWFLEDGNKYKD